MRRLELYCGVSADLIAICGTFEALRASSDASFACGSIGLVKMFGAAMGESGRFALAAGAVVAASNIIGAGLRVVREEVASAVLLRVP